MIQQPHQPNELIDRALQSLRDTKAPTGLEARIAARLTQAAEARAITTSSFADTYGRTSFFAVILSIVKNPRILLAQVPLYAVAAAALLAASLFAFHHHQVSTTVAHSNPQPVAAPNQPLSPVQTSSLATTRVPQGFSLGFHRTTKGTGALAPAPNDPDTLALAETLAPSHPAPRMPLTPQEHLLLLATRQGQPIEVAELDIARQPALQAASDLHQRALIRRYAQSLLGPLAAAEALNPTSTPPSPDEAPSPQPPSSK